MKKINFLIVIFAIGLALVSCEPEEADLDNVTQEEIVEYDQSFYEKLYYAISGKVIDLKNEKPLPEVDAKIKEMLNSKINEYYIGLRSFKSRGNSKYIDTNGVNAPLTCASSYKGNNEKFKLFINIGTQRFFLVQNSKDIRSTNTWLYKSYSNNTPSRFYFTYTNNSDGTIIIKEAGSGKILRVQGSTLRLSSDWIPNVYNKSFYMINS